MKYYDGADLFISVLIAFILTNLLWILLTAYAADRLVVQEIQDDSSYYYRGRVLTYDEVRALPEDYHDQLCIELAR